MRFVRNDTTGVAVILRGEFANDDAPDSQTKSKREMMVMLDRCKSCVSFTVLDEYNGAGVPYSGREIELEQAGSTNSVWASDGTTWPDVHISDAADADGNFYVLITPNTLAQSIQNGNVSVVGSGYKTSIGIERDRADGKYALNVPDSAVVSDAWTGNTSSLRVVT